MPMASPRRITTGLAALAVAVTCDGPRRLLGVDGVDQTRSVTVVGNGKVTGVPDTP